MTADIPKHLANSWEEQPNSYLLEIYNKHKAFLPAEWGIVAYSDGGSCGRVKYPRLKVKHGDRIYLFSHVSDCQTQIWVYESEITSEQAVLELTINYKVRRGSSSVFDVRDGSINIGFNRLLQNDLEKFLDFICPASCEIKEVSS